MDPTTNPTAIARRAGQWVEDTLHELARHATITYGPIEYDRDAAELIAYEHTYRELQCVAGNSGHPYRDGARIALNGLKEPELYGEDEVPEIGAEFFPFYADAAAWVGEDAYTSMVRDPGGEQTQAALGVPKLVTDGGQTDDGEIPDGGAESMPEDLEMEDHPLTTIYQNVREMPRRDFLKHAALGLGGYAVWRVHDERLRSRATTASERDTGGDGVDDGNAPGSGSTDDAGPYEIRVEVDRMEGVDPMLEREQHLLTREFAEAPVDVDIDLILEPDEVVPANDIIRSEGPGELDDFGEYAAEYFDHADEEGYRYALLATPVVREDEEGDTVVYEPSWAATIGILVRDPIGKWYPDRFQTDGVDLERVRASTFMHELGHSLGVGSTYFGGIDSYDIPFEEYPSVMNYNAPREFLGYSDGTNSDRDFNDWGHITASLT